MDKQMNTFMDIQIYWIDIQSDGWIESDTQTEKLMATLIDK